MTGTLVRLGWLNLKRDRTALVLTFVLPVVFFSIFAGVFGDMDGDDVRPVAAVVVSEDAHPAAVALRQRLLEEPSL